ncbi:MAG TPA: amidohydrolase family protein [Thermomicrobiales bacterium]|nr:amidohydrolase family protein [Thermomicrobiales bacterium]
MSLVVAGRLVEGGERVRLTIDGARVAEIDPADDAPDLWIAPGLFDIQINGYGGQDANGANVTPEEIVHLTHAVWRSGVTTFCPTIITNDEASICRSLAAIREARDRDPLVAHAIPSIHVEGPYIAREDGPRGAHALQHVRPPDQEEYQRWQAAANGLIGIVTLSPEYAEAPEYIRRVIADGVVAAIGHTAATTTQIEAAVLAGARLSTHLGNAAHASLPRHPNYLWDQLAEDRLTASFIFDGHHLPPSVMKTFVRAKGIDRSILVSDAMSLSGLPTGQYELPGNTKVELLPSGRLNLLGTPFLAGSTTSLPDCIGNAMRYTGATLADAVRMATLNPFRLLNLDPRRYAGSVRGGGPADLTLLQVDTATGDITPMATIVMGQVVWQADERVL